MIHPNAFPHDKALVEGGASIGAGTVVTNSVLAGVVVVGNSARVIRLLAEASDEPGLRSLDPQGSAGARQAADIS